MKNLIVDVQVLQTPALKRGMGQYVLSLLRTLENEESINVTLLFSSFINNDFSKEAHLRLAKFSQVDLPLLSMRQTNKTNEAIRKNKKTINDWLNNQSLDNVSFLMSSIFQAEIYSAFPDNVTKTAIMYDVIPLQLFELYSQKMRWGDYLDRFSVVYEADILFCISETTASDAQIYANVRPESIVVLNGGPGDLAKPKEPSKAPEGRFIVMPTGNDIRKNNHLGVEAFNIFNKENGKAFKLIVTSTFTSDEKDRLRDICSEVEFTGVLSDEELAWYYKNSSAVLFPSLYEGLGMPLIEALNFNKPIAASNIDVFLEISDSVAHYFSPNNVKDMSAALHSAVFDKITDEQKKEAKRVVEKYTWENSSKILLESLQKYENESVSLIKKKKIAVVGPHVTGSSAIGKFISELHPVLSKKFDVDYYYEKSPIDKVLRPDILGHVASYEPIYKLTNSRLNQYSKVIYHIGNSNHHSITLARALTCPSVVILHDLNIENAYKDLLERKLIGEDRVQAEKKLDSLKNTKSAFIQSLSEVQKSIIVHSDYAHKIVNEIVSDPAKIKRAQLAVGTPLFLSPRKNTVFTVGLAGILAGIKGLETIERIAARPEFINDRFMLFGLNFAEPGSLDRLRKLPNVDVTTDLSDFEFQQKLRSLDVLVNFRTKYQGEASYATLEAMRYGIPVIVRGDFGWYSELPDNAVLKAVSEEQITELILSMKNDIKMRNLIRENSREATMNDFSARQYVDIIEKIEETRK